ncbi:glycoside hydrolase family 140 protein [Silvibacterium acidisoli]|uniref:glycoside hydrolase family 140 protein n=1 Tax=Acidobacteriaceae bacterium ZG23-2 TaxID=2883246 RepID=UPI00406CD998
MAASATASPAFANVQTSEKPARLPRIRVHNDGHLLETEDGKPFFWLGDTAWQLIASTTREECSHYLQTRARQGYSIFQTVVLAEMDGIRKETPLGMRPFENDDPRRPVDAYFDRVVEIVREAGSRGLYVALVPVWGDKLTAPWGAGPKIFRNDNLADAEAYTRYLANRMRGEPNVVWILGGDRPPQLTGIQDKGMLERAARQGWPADTDWKPIWRALARGLKDGSETEPLILYHPSGGSESSSVFLHKETWLSVNGIQSGHSAHDADIWNQIARDYTLTPAKPTLDLEPNYEDHPFSPWPSWDPATGYFRDHDVRKQVYRSVFAGGCGVTYGHHAIWQFADARNGIINHADMDWVTALERPTGRQMIFLRQLIESRPYFTRIPDPSLLVDDGGQGILHMQATRDRDGSFAMIYIPMHDQEVRLNLAKLRTRHLRAWWYDTRTGFAKPIGVETYSEQANFKTPPYGPDWVLVLDDADVGYGVPGIGLVKG